MYSGSQASPPIPGPIQDSWDPSSRRPIQCLQVVTAHHKLWHQVANMQKCKVQKSIRAKIFMPSSLTSREMCCMFDTYSLGHCLQSCKFQQFERNCILISDEQCATGTLHGVPGGGYLPCAPTGVGTSPSGGSLTCMLPFFAGDCWRR